MPATAKTLPPTDQDARIARTSVRALSLLVSHEREEPLHLHVNGEQQEITLPLSAARLLLNVLQEMGKGNGVAITPVQQQFTTQQAADFLLVSRPYLIEELLEKGRIPYRKVGNRRRIRYEDLLRFQEEEERDIARREEAMLELMAETERLGLYK